MPSWFAESEMAALRDVWSVYDAQFDAIADAIDRAAPAHPIDRAATRAALQVAMDGGWDAHEAHLRSEAARLARSGVGLGAWHDRAAAFHRHLGPLLVDAYAAEPDRLRAALVAMHQYADR